MRSDERGMLCRSFRSISRSSSCPSKMPGQRQQKNSVNRRGTKMYDIQPTCASSDTRQKPRRRRRRLQTGAQHGSDAAETFSISSQLPAPTHHAVRTHSGLNAGGRLCRVSREIRRRRRRQAAAATIRWTTVLEVR